MTSKDLEVVDTTSIWDGCYKSAFIYDSYLVLIAACDEYFFHVYDKHSLEFRGKFGLKGRGPYDFYMPFPFRTNTTTNINDSIHEFYDLNLRKIKGINFNKTGNNEELSESITTKDQDVNLFECDMLNKLTESKIAGHDINIGTTDGMFFIYDRETKKKEWIDYMPNFKMEPEYRWQAYYGEII